MAMMESSSIRERNHLDGLPSRLNALLKSNDGHINIDDAILLLEECIEHHDTLPTAELSLERIQALAAYIEACTIPVKLPRAEQFLDKVLPFLIYWNPDVDCKTKWSYRICFQRCIFKRLCYSVLFTLLNNMSRGTRKALETSLFTRHSHLMETAYNMLFSNLDFEEKISIVELLWRGIRRATKTDLKGIMKNEFLKGIKNLTAAGFEMDAIRWLESTNCLNDSLGFYKLKGKMELNLTSTCHILEHDFGEIVLMPSMLRIHVLPSEGNALLKVEVPYSHMVTASISSDCLDVSFKFTEDGFNLSGLWSAALQEEVAHVPCSDGVFLMKLLFVDPFNVHLKERMSSISEVISKGTGTNVETTEERMYIPEDDLISAIASDEMGDSEVVKIKLNMIPNSLMFSNRRKAEAYLPCDRSVTTEDCKLIEKISKQSVLHSSPSTVGFHPRSVSLSTEASNSISSCEQPFFENLLAQPNRTMALHGTSPVEPLMISLEYYREAKTKEMNSIFKRIYREEVDQAIAEISKLCAIQNAKRKEIHGAYRREADALVKEIEENHLALTDQLKGLISEFDALRNNNMVKDPKRKDISKLHEDGSSLMSSCNALVQSTDKAIKEIDDVILRIKKHYIKKKQECSRALEGLYSPKNVNKRPLT